MKGKISNLFGKAEMKKRIKNSKRSISIILLFIVSTMLIGIFSACEGIGNDPGTEYADVFWKYTPELEPLTQSQADAFNRARFIHATGMTPEEYIESASEEEKERAKDIVESSKYLSSKKEKTRVYLGTFNGSIVVVEIGDLMEGTEYRLGEYSFSTAKRSTGYVYSNEMIYGIEEAYELGILTDEDAAKIVERINQYYDARNKLFRGEFSE